MIGFLTTLAFFLSSPGVESDEYILLSDYYLESGQVDSAIGVLREAFSETGRYEFLLKIAEILIDRGEYEKALSYTARCLKKTEGPDVYRLHALALYGLRRKKDAFRTVKAGLRKYPENPSLLHLIGNLYDIEENREKALKYYIKALERAPDSTDILVDYAALLYRKGQSDSALSILERIYDRVEGNYRAELTLSGIYEEKGGNEKALEHLEKAHSMNPMSVPLLVKLGQLNIDLGNYEDAVKYLSMARSLSPLNADTRRLLGIALYRVGEREEALDEELVALYLTPRNSEVHYYLARIFTEMRADSLALKHIRKAIKLKPRPEYRIFEAYLLVSGERFRKAIRKLKSMKRDLNPVGYYLLGTAHFGLKKYKDALKYFRKASELDPDNYGYKRTVVDLLERLGRKEEAIDLLVKLSELYPDSTEPRFRLAMLYAETGEMARAESLFALLAREDSTDAAVYNNWGYFLATRGGDLDSAQKLVKKALDLEPENPLYLDSMGWIYYLKGDYDRAFEYLKKAVEKEGDDPEILEHMGEILMKLGERKEALKYLRRALKIDPTREGLREKIKRYEKD